MRLQDKVCLVTGGAAGIGRATAERFAEEGATVILCDLNEEQGRATAAAIGGHFYKVNVADRQAVGAWVDEVVAQYGRVDVLVNNAGATWGAPIEDYPLEAWDKVMNLNIRSIFLFCQAVGKASMLPRRYGRIINVASIAGLSGSLDVKFIAYGTSKGAVVNFTRTLAAEWGPQGITVNALAPGFFPSKMTRGTLQSVGVDKLAAAAPLRRIGDDDDLKGAALLFASAAGKHITGQILAVDGGVSSVHGG